MPFVKVGDRVTVDLEGLSAPGVAIGGGVSAKGVIVGVDLVGDTVTVQLKLAFGGRNLITVSPDRVSLVEA